MGKLKNHIILIILIIPFTCFSQEWEVEDSYSESLFSIGIETNFNTEDVFLGVSAIVGNPKLLSGIISIYARPYKKKVLYKSGGINYILMEYKFLYLIGVDKEFKIYNNTYAYGNAMFGLESSYYAGSNKDNTSLIFPVTNVGIEFKLTNANWRIGYQYFDLDDFKHRINIAILFKL